MWYNILTMRHQEISLEHVQPSLRPLSKHEYQTQFDQRVKGTSPLHEETFGEIPEDNGDGFVSFQQRHAITTSRLEGSALTLNSQSLIRYQDFMIPLEITKQTVEDMLYGRRLAKRCFALIRINEPGIFKAVKTDMNGIFYRNIAALEPAVETGTVNALNNTLVDRETHHDLIHGLQETWRLVSEIRAEEAAYIDAVLGIVINKQDGSGFKGVN